MWDGLPADPGQGICSNLEDYRASMVLTSKAFNRLSYQHCLRAFAAKGASPIIRLLATFLSNRTMTVRVEKLWSAPRAVSGGCSQGSILGVFLFNVTTDDLEERAARVRDNREAENGDDEDWDELYHVRPDPGSGWGARRSWIQSTRHRLDVETCSPNEHWNLATNHRSCSTRVDRRGRRLRSRSRPIAWILARKYRRRGPGWRMSPPTCCL